MEINELKKLLENYHIPFTSQMADAFLVYSKLLAEWNEKMNLTALAEDDFIEKHFYDSLLLVKTHNFTDQKVLDVGTGAGFPGLPLKIVFPDLKITLVEPTTKRCTFLQAVVDKLDLKSVTILNKRAEELAYSLRETFDVVVARAVANLPMILELSVPFVKVDGLFIALKGPGAEQELEASKHAIKALNVKLAKIDKSYLPSDHSLRLNLVFLKQKSTADKYPRNYALIKRKPL